VSQCNCRPEFEDILFSLSLTSCHHFVGNYSALTNEASRGYIGDSTSIAQAPMASKSTSQQGEPRTPTEPQTTIAVGATAASNSTSAIDTGPDNNETASDYKSFATLGIAPPEEPQHPANFVAQPPVAPQRRPRSRNVTPQDGPPARDAAAGRKPKYLGGVPVTTYVDCVTAQRNGSNPPRGYPKPDEWKPGAEHQAIAIFKILSKAPPPCLR
jgi:hypothetical protein